LSSDRNVTHTIIECKYHIVFCPKFLINVGVDLDRGQLNLGVTLNQRRIRATHIKTPTLWI
jgi:hypothetical protein